MKIRFASLAFSFIALVANLSAQEVGKPAEISANPGATVVTSEVFRLDMAQKQGVFTGNVLVVANDFKLKATEITVFFAADGSNKIERLVARGAVEIEQSDRNAKSNQAEYLVAQDKMILSGSPEITQRGGNRLTGSTITIYRSSNRMEVDGRSRVVLYNELSAPK
jgi:lipopolysaccharide export system protein LptA